MDNPTTRSDLSPSPFSTDLFPTFVQLIYIVIHRAEINATAILFPLYMTLKVSPLKKTSTLQCTRRIHAWVSAPRVGAPTLCYSLFVARAPRGIRFAQMPRYRAETPSTSFLPSGWCEHVRKSLCKSVKSV